MRLIAHLSSVFLGSERTLVRERIPDTTWRHFLPRGDVKDCFPGLLFSSTWPSSNSPLPKVCCGELSPGHESAQYSNLLALKVGACNPRNCMLQLLSTMGTRITTGSWIRKLYEHTSGFLHEWRWSLSWHNRYNRNARLRPPWGPVVIRSCGDVSVLGVGVHPTP